MPLQTLSDVGSLYGEQDLGSWSLFGGGYINFGFWPDSIKNNLSKADRQLASYRLYKQVCDQLNFSEEDNILEVGSGLGAGCRMISSEYPSRGVLGIDASLEQVKRSQKLSRSDCSANKIRFSQCAAENIDSLSTKFHKIISIEALQHFSSYPCFVKKAYDTLYLGGDLAVATFFFNRDPNDKFLEAFPNFESNIDKIVPLDRYVETLRVSGFTDIATASIGANVWEGFDQWIAQTEFSDSWNRHWLQAYYEEILDYYIVIARKH